MAKKTIDKKKGKKRTTEDLAGLHIYKDDHNRYVYYDIFSKAGYVINNIPTYKTYSSRFVIGLLVGFLVYSFGLQPWIALLLGFGMYVFMEVRFRAFLKKQTILINFHPKERPPRILVAASEEKKRLYLKIVLYFIFAVLIILLPFTDDGKTYDMVLKTLCILIGIAACAMSIFQGYALVYKNKNGIEDSNLRR